MLKSFSVENFKCFQKKFVFDLSKTSNYEFNCECVKKGIVNKGAIYGINGIGKSNLGLAIFDIVNTLTDKVNCIDKYDYFLNLDSNKPYATFRYEFVFDDNVLVYEYSKKNVKELIKESLTINGNEMLWYDFRDKKGESLFVGTENLSLISDSVNSRVRYILETALIQDENKENSVLASFKKFVNEMLLFYSLRENRFIGYKEHPDYIESTIIAADKVSDFEEFLNSQGLDVKVVCLDTPEGKKLYFKYKNGVIPFFKACSTGTSSLILLFSWIIDLENCSFVYIDEFDAFYHYELAEAIIKILKKFDKTQIFVTTHNTDLLNNDLLRPDCYFHLQKRKINSLDAMTSKTLRFAHNLQKMYKAGSFDEE